MVMLRCPSCETKLHASDKSAGKTVRCPRCKRVLSVPSTAEPWGRSSAEAAVYGLARPEDEVDELEEVEDEEEIRDVRRSRDRRRKKPFADNNEEIAYELPLQQAETVLDHLSGKERLLWVGKPLSKLLVVRTIPLVIFGVIFTCVALIPTLLLVRVFGFLPVMIGLVMSLVGIGMICSPFFAVAPGKLNYYALTTRRALVWRGGYFYGANLEEYNVFHLGTMKRYNSWVVPGAGDLVFREEVHVHYHTTPRGGTSTTRSIIRYGFLAIRDIDHVERLIRKHLINKVLDRLDD